VGPARQVSNLQPDRYEREDKARLLSLLHFHQRSSVFAAPWQGRFWCETGAVRAPSLYEIIVRSRGLYSWSLN
jgi:hypothetical protein